MLCKEHGAPILHAVLQSASKQDRLCDILVNETPSAVYVSDIDTYELLYLNQTAAQMLGERPEAYTGQKCYEHLFQRTSPCPFCKMQEMDETHFSEREFEHPYTHRVYRLKGKRIDWCSRNAHVEYILDATAESRAQQKLRQTQALLTAALHNTKVTVWEYDLATKSILQTINSQDTHGFDTVISNVPEALIENGFVHPQSAEDFRALYRDVFAGKEKAQRDIFVQTLDRTGYWWERIIYIPVTDASGNVIKAIGTSMDVTEQKNLEQSFREIEALRSKTTNGIMINVSKNTLDTMYSEVDEIAALNNGNLTDFFQKSRLRIPDATKRKAYDAIFNRESLLRAYAVGKTEQFVETLYECKTGEYRTLQLHIRLTKNPKTEDVVGYSYVVDVDAERTMQSIMDKVALDNFEFIMLLDLPKNSSMMVSNPSHSMKTAPKAYENYNEGITAFCDHFVIESERARCKEQLLTPVLKAQLAQQPKYVVTLPTSLDSAHKDVHIKRLCYSYLNKEQGKVLITSEDITELVRAEQEKNKSLARALHTAQKASAAKSEFLSNMSHDMRTPMNAILGFSQMALDEQASCEEMRTSMQKINASGHYLLNLINDVLDMSKIESHKMELHLEPVDAASLFDGIMASIRPLMQAKNIDFTFEIKSFIPHKAAVLDALRTQQIFVNLLSNAAKFTPPGGRVECTIESLHFDGRFSTEQAVIRDNGCGMSDEFLAKALLPFEQERPESNAQRTGTGLGLSIVKSLIDLMGGSISIHSTQGVGTEVVLNFTTELVDESQARNAPPPCTARGFGCRRQASFAV